MTPAIPYALLDSLKEVKGFDKDAFIEAHQQPIQTSVRLNPDKPFHIEGSALTLDQPVPWSSYGYYLKSRPSFTLDPIFHAGGYYVQEASSMFLEQALRQSVDLSKSLKVLDLCAAPGGKSTLIQSILSEDSMLVCNEVIKPRVNILIENISKWGATNVVVTNNDPAHFQRIPEYFDVMVADAPCSGSGLFRKEPDAIGEWSENNVALCSQRQRRILSDVLPALKVGGVLIYSTCSYSVEENEMISQWLKKEHQLSPIPLDLNANSGIVACENHDGYRFFPHQLAGEGFYLQVFQKTSTSGTYRHSLQKFSPIKPMSFNSPWINSAAKGVFTMHQDHIHFSNRFIAEELSLLQKNLYVRKAGVMVGQAIKNEHIPSHELAMCKKILTEDIASITLDHKQSISYLRKEAFDLPEHTPKGWQLFQYDNLPLGFAKVLPNRINNYYPQEWKILQSASK